MVNKDKVCELLLAWKEELFLSGLTYEESNRIINGMVEEISKLED